MNEEITIKVNGKRYGGWQALEIHQGLNQLTSSFAMKYTDKYPNQISNVTFKMGESCSVYLNDNLLLNGYIEEIETSYDSTSHTLEVRGRDKLCDLVDCSYWFDEYVNEWKDQSIESLIRRLCILFNIDVRVDGTVKEQTRVNVFSKLKKFKIEEGETIADTLVRICKTSAILPISYGDGKLTLTRAATNRKTTTNLKTGVNILSARTLSSNIERYSIYVVKGQDNGSDNLFALGDFVQPEASQTDSLITRRRPLVLLHEEIADSGKCQARAIWEANTRAGRSRQYQYSVVGWLQKDGTPWPLNATIKVDDYINSVNEELLIEKIVFKLDENGRITTLDLVDKKTYELIEQAEKIKNTKYDLDQATLESFYN